MRTVEKLVLAAAIALTPSLASAVELGSPKAGQAYAERVCAECHEVQAGDSFSPNPTSPTFQEIADTPGMTARALAVFLTTSHPTMPDIMIERDDLDNVIAYVTSLRRPR
jgi:mono/diheme cytochrome c family protein